MEKASQSKKWSLIKSKAMLVKCDLGITLKPEDVVVNNLFRYLKDPFT